MKKEISVRSFASIKRVAMNVNPLVTKKNKLIAKTKEMQDEIELLNKEIEGHEMGIMALTGGYKSEDLLTKVVTKLDKLDKNGKPLTETKYIPTDLVEYDDIKKVYYVGSEDEVETVETTVTDDSFAENEEEASTEDDMFNA